MKFQAPTAVVFLLTFTKLDGILGASVEKAQIFDESSVFTNTRVLTAKEPIRHSNGHVIVGRKEHKCYIYPRDINNPPLTVATTSTEDHKTPTAQVLEECEIDGRLEDESDSEHSVREDANGPERDSPEESEDRGDVYEKEMFRDELEQAQDDNENQGPSNLEDPAFFHVFENSSGANKKREVN